MPFINSLNKLSGTQYPERDQQFTQISILRTRADSEILPNLGVDTKK